MPYCWLPPLSACFFLFVASFLSKWMINHLLRSFCTGCFCICSSYWIFIHAAKDSPKHPKPKTTKKHLEHVILNAFHPCFSWKTGIPWLLTVYFQHMPKPNCAIHLPDEYKYKFHFYIITIYSVSQLFFSYILYLRQSPIIYYFVRQRHPALSYKIIHNRL